MIIANLRDLPRATSLSAVLSGLLVIVIGSAASLVIVFQAANNASLSEAQISSWVLAITVGSGLASIAMSLWYRMPVIAAWSTPGVALLVTSLAGYSFGEAVGAYVVSAIAITLIGFSGLFGWIMARIPQPVVMGMLAGVLIKFGFGLFDVIAESPVLVIGMIGVYFVLRRFNFRAPTVIALVVGLVIAAISGTIRGEPVPLSLAVPLWTPPVFTLPALLGLALPLTALALTSQNAPGLAVLRNAGYTLRIDGALIITGVLSLLTAPFGGHGLTLAAITAALVTGPEAHPDSNQRYSAGVATGIWYLFGGIFGATLVSLFTILPHALIAATAGLGLANAIMSSLSASMSDPDGREGGLIALLCTAANFSLFGIGAPFWGLVFGVLTHGIIHWGKRKGTTAATQGTQR
jgi:benzoate membrane transport protein